MRTAIIIAFLFSATWVHAEPMLLVEISWEQPFDVTLPAPYTVHTSISEISATADSRVIVDQFPHTQTIQQLDQLNAILTQDDYEVFIRMWNGGDSEQYAVDPNQGCGVCVLSELLSEPMPPPYILAEWDVDRYAPSRGLNLSGYRLTSAEQYIDAGEQLLRLYGEVVPEPVTLLLVAILAGTGLVCQGRRKARATGAMEWPPCSSACASPVTAMCLTACVLLLKP
jgi:hypothetical protein